jgi:hypothetical protein
MKTAYYYRASSKSQDTKSQEADMNAHAANEPNAGVLSGSIHGQVDGPSWLEPIVGGRSGRSRARDSGQGLRQPGRRMAVGVRGAGGVSIPVSSTTWVPSVYLTTGSLESETVVMMKQ